MKKTDPRFERFNKVLELGKIYEPIRREIMKEWEDWENPDIFHRRDDDKIAKLLNKLIKECPYLYDNKRMEVHRVFKSFTDCGQDHQILYLYIRLKFDSEELGIDWIGTDNPIIGIRNGETPEEIVKDCAVTDKEYFDDCLQEAIDLLRSKDVVGGFKAQINPFKK